MKYSIEIESTEKCPFRSGVNDFILRPKCHHEEVSFHQFPDCVGLGNPGCPFQEESCDTCGHSSYCKMNFGSYGWQEDDDCITHCSAYRRAK